MSLWPINEKYNPEQEKIESISSPSRPKAENPLDVPILNPNTDAEALSVIQSAVAAKQAATLKAKEQK